MHVAKFNRASGTRIIAHVTRSRETVTESTIHPELTKNNITIQDCNVKGYQEICDRYAKRKDAVTLCDCVVTLPEELKNAPTQKQIEFFNVSHEALKKMWPHCATSVIHFDETTPHLHYTFLPIEKTQDGKSYHFNAKNLVSRNVLKKLHPTVEKAVREAGFKVKLFEHDEKQKQINHDLGISTKTMHEFRKDAIDFNSKELAVQLTDLQKELARSMRSVKRQPGEDKSHYKQRRQERVEVSRDAFKKLQELELTFDVQAMAAHTKKLSVESVEARKELDKQFDYMNKVQEQARASMDSVERQIEEAVQLERKRQEKIKAQELAKAKEVSDFEQAEIYAYHVQDLQKHCGMDSVEALQCLYRDKGKQALDLMVEHGFLARESVQRALKPLRAMERSWDERIR